MKTIGAILVAIAILALAVSYIAGQSNNSTDSDAPAAPASNSGLGS